MFDVGAWDNAVAKYDQRSATDIVDELVEGSGIACACFGPLPGTGSLCACFYREEVLTAVIHIHLVRQIKSRAQNP